MSDLAVVVVTHDSAHDLEACVASVLTHRGDADVDIVVCDSGSSDDVEAVARRLPVDFLRGPNRGFAAGCNRGIEVAQQTGARYVLFLNPDVRLAEGTLSDLMAECDRRPRAGVVTVRQLDQHGRLVRNIGRPSTPAAYWRMALMGRSELEWDSSSYDTERSCAWVVGSFLLARRETIDQLGGFDERFFLYRDDVDLCRRACAAGWDVRYLPILTTTHAVADRPFDLHRERLLALSKLLYARKWYPGWRSTAMRAGLVLFYARHLLKQRRAGFAGQREWTHLKATLRPDWDQYGPA